MIPWILCLLLCVVCCLLGVGLGLAIERSNARHKERPDGGLARRPSGLRLTLWDQNRRQWREAERPREPDATL